ncbi:hypothetical protein [Cognatilysobacter lacus]|uniref:Uncharacterized protein n=1 Tax=Cognatilysobacter lacus TaxID=1643323 RepID=A0A5D8Z5F6_9GAMM|nr:hypothetical protein [Lysobacter lacus]TZF89880.1 hypothetical protein FW784_07555 [Lysobacter lacus]
MRMSIPAILAIAMFPALAPPSHAQALPSSGPFVAIDVPVAALDADDAAGAAQAPAVDDPSLGPAVASDALDVMRGGTGNKTTITNTSTVDGTVDHNSATNAITGGNLVDGGAFGNATGLSTVIQNTGNNVLIQNSTVVSVLFSPTP